MIPACKAIDPIIPLSGALGKEPGVLVCLSDQLMILLKRRW